MLSPSKNIIVVAPDLGLRQSLTFALEVEGYQVEAHDSWCCERGVTKPTLCMIIDDQVLRTCGEATKLLRSSDHAIIYLSDGISTAPTDGPQLTLTKPFDGADLLKLVRSVAMAA